MTRQHYDMPSMRAGTRRILASRADQQPDGPIRCRERLGGLLKYYHRKARMSFLTTQGQE